MNILSANEIKRHGVSVIEQQLKNGPVHVLKHNQPLFVVLTEPEHQALITESVSEAQQVCI